MNLTTWVNALARKPLAVSARGRRRRSRLPRKPRLEMLESRTVLANSNFAVSLVPVQPLGGLVYQGLNSQTISAPGNTDTFTLSIAPNSTVAAIVHPTSGLFQPTLTLFAPSGRSLGSVTAAAKGQNAAIPLVQSSSGGVYKFVVTGAGATTGGFTINTILNALTEPENNGGPSNNTPATAQPLDGSAVTFVGQDNRMAVLGAIANASDNADCYSFQLQAGESATVVASALNSKVVRFALEDDQGNVLGFSQGGTASISAVLNNFVAPSNGTYFVLVSGAIGVQYNLVVTRGADFSTAPNNTLATPQDLTATELSGNGKLGGVLGYLTNPSGGIGTDFYSVQTNIGDNLHFATSTPVGALNGFYPELLLYDPNGNLVAVAAGNASDGRNSVIDFTVPDGDSGSWTIEVTPSPNTQTPTQGEFGLLVTGATGALSPFVVTASNPPAGALVQPPSKVIITFNDPVLGTSLTPGELEVNGVAATAVSLVNANTVDWFVPSSAYATGIVLPNVVTIGADAFGNQVVDVSGQTLTPFSYTFFTTGNAPPPVSPPPPASTPNNSNFSVSLTPVKPLGSLVYQNTTSQTITGRGYSDTFTLSIAPNSTLAAIVHPTSGLFQPTLTLFAPSGRSLGSISAAAKGQNAVIPLMQSSGGGVYKLVVTGAGGTTGGFTINTILNALTEPESNGGPSNNTPDTAQPLDGSAVTFVGQDNRMAVLGAIANASDNADCYSFQLQAGESATVVASALNGKAVRFALEDDQGNVLGFSQGGTASISAVLNNFVAPSNGTYFVLVSGAIGVQYNLVVTRGADFSTAPNNTLATPQDLTATELSGNGKLGGVLGYLTNPSGGIGTDFYSVQTNIGDNLHFATSTPAGALNGLYPELLLYDPNGNLVAIAAGNASDGRNSVIDFTVPDGDSGPWTIEVTPSPNTQTPTQGEFGLLVTGATGALSPFVVTASNPPAGALVQPPSKVIITFNDPVLGTSLTPGELEVNGVAATAVSLVNANTVDWFVPSSAYATGIVLPNVVTIGADAFGNQVVDVSGQTLTPFSYTFFTTNVAPSIISSSIDGAAFSPAPADVTEVVTFSQPMNTTFTTAAAFGLLGNHSNVHYAAASFSWDPTGTILTINYANLPADTYTLTLYASGFQNVVGLSLASTYVANFTVA